MFDLFLGFLWAMLFVKRGCRVIGLRNGERELEIIAGSEKLIN